MKNLIAMRLRHYLYFPKKEFIIMVTTSSNGSLIETITTVLCDTPHYDVRKTNPIMKLPTKSSRVMFQLLV